MPDVKGMINSDDRTGLRQSISLDHDETTARPERFEFRIQTRSSNHECPKLPAETDVCGDDTVFVDGRLQVFENPRNTNRNCNSIVMDQLNDSLWMDFCGHHNRTFKDDGYEQSHGLTEHVTERE